MSNDQAVYNERYKLLVESGDARRDIAPSEVTICKMNDQSYLTALKEYIERCEQAIDGERGMSRDLERIIADGDMPAVYDETLRRINHTS